ncbi:DUF1127 domain-containing protein [Bradyrhizobium diazoefficiens]|nr:DUF1127 domain-containing protein [Bradyrhizobium diazoefficiens]MBR0774975.1 DUF1127 domain-containing protein [Bradyrhizobium diazoefficiens]
MSTTYGDVGLGHTATTTRRVSNLFRKWLNAYRQRRQRRRLQAALCNLSDRELMDIGTTRGEIDYVVSNPGTDPRGARSVM